MDQRHLDALQLRLSHERARLENARTTSERETRAVWVAGIEKEIAHEYERLDIFPAECDVMSDDDLLNALDIE